MKKAAKIMIIVISAVGLTMAVSACNNFSSHTNERTAIEAERKGLDEVAPTAAENEALHPMSIKALRAGVYPGGEFKIERTLDNGTNYRQYIASYLSEGLKIYGLLTVPTAVKPAQGFPAVVFVHGYINPKLYSTTGNYPSYQAALARGGFITFKPDLRGHGKSEGVAEGAHYTEKYVIDTLNAIAYLKDYKDTDPVRIGYWGHSNGGEIGLRVLVVSRDIKAASFWAGVVGSYRDMLETYNEKISFLHRATSTDLVIENGLPSANPAFWNSLDPYSYLDDISAPVELQHATGDKSVPIELSERLQEELKKAGKAVTFYKYLGDDHNIAKNSGLAWQRTTKFFKDNL